MADRQQVARVAREMFLAAFAGASSAFGMEAWVIERMTGLLEDKALEPGDMLFRAGEPADHIYFLAGGRVRCEQEGYPPWRFEGHWVLGILDVMQERPHSRTAIAETPVRLARFRTTEWLDLLDESFELKRSAIGSGVDSVAKLMEQLLLLEGGDQSPPLSAGSVDESLLSIVDRLLLLIDLPMFHSAGVQTLADLAALMTERIVEPGSTIHERNAPRTALSVIVEGVVESRRRDPDLAMRFMRGHIAGGPLIVGPSAQHWETIALTRTKLLVLSAEDWFDEMEEHFGLARSALVALAAEREQLLNRICKITDSATIV